MLHGANHAAPITPSSSVCIARFPVDSGYEAISEEIGWLYSTSIMCGCGLGPGGGGEGGHVETNEQPLGFVECAVVIEIVMLKDFFRHLECLGFRPFYFSIVIAVGCGK